MFVATQRHTRKVGFWELGVWVSAATVVVVLACADPSSSRWFPPCPFHALTGLDCPGCGSTRALHALLHGHVGAAINFNLLTLPGLAMVALGFGQQHSERLRKWWLPLNRPKVILVVVLAFWLLRNLPFEPFLWLSSGH